MYSVSRPRTSGGNRRGRHEKFRMSKTVRLAAGQDGFTKFFRSRSYIMRAPYSRRPHSTPMPLRSRVKPYKNKTSNADFPFSFQQPFLFSLSLSEFVVRDIPCYCTEDGFPRRREASLAQDAMRLFTRTLPYSRMVRLINLFLNPIPPVIEVELPARSELNPHH